MIFDIGQICALVGRLSQTVQGQGIGLRVIDRPAFQHAGVPGREPDAVHIEIEERIGDAHPSGDPAVKDRATGGNAFDQAAVIKADAAGVAGDGGGGPIRVAPDIPTAVDEGELRAVLAQKALPGSLCHPEVDSPDGEGFGVDAVKADLLAAALQGQDRHGLRALRCQEEEPGTGAVDDGDIIAVILQGGGEGHVAAQLDAKFIEFAVDQGADLIGFEQLRRSGGLGVVAGDREGTGFGVVGEDPVAQDIRAVPGPDPGPVHHQAKDLRIDDHIGHQFHPVPAFQIHAAAAKRGISGVDKAAVHQRDAAGEAVDAGGSDILAAKAGLV